MHPKRKFTLTINAYLAPFPETSNLSFDEIRHRISSHAELHDLRKSVCLQWIDQAEVGQKYRTFTDTLESDQADVFFTREN